MRRASLCGALWLLCTLWPHRALGQDIFEFQIYGSHTQGARNIAPQLLSTFVEKGRGEAGQGIPEQNTFRGAVELEYGLTDHIDFAYYLNFAVDQQGTQYAGSKFRFRGSFGEPGEMPIDIGWYAEIETWRTRFDDDTVEAELMLTMQKNIDKWGFIFNLPDIEKVLKGASVKDAFELSWRAEVRYRYSESLHFGMQTFGGIGSISAVEPIQQQRHYLVPVVHVALASDIKATFGIVLGLTQAADVAMFKVNLTFNGHEQDWD